MQSDNPGDALARHCVAHSHLQAPTLGAIHHTALLLASTASSLGFSFLLCTMMGLDEMTTKALPLFVPGGFGSVCCL